MAEQPCPHVNGPMIAAGFIKCAVCEKNPAAAKEDTSAQEAALAKAYDELAAAFDAAAAEATKQAKACRRKRPAPNMDAWRTATRGVALGEQGVDTAVYDLTTARGADG